MPCWSEKWTSRIKSEFWSDTWSVARSISRIYVNFHRWKSTSFVMAAIGFLPRNHEIGRPGKQLLCELNGFLAGRGNTVDWCVLRINKRGLKCNLLSDQLHKFSKWSPFFSSFFFYPSSLLTSLHTFSLISIATKMNVISLNRSREATIY